MQNEPTSHKHAFVKDEWGTHLEDAFAHRSNGKYNEAFEAAVRAEMFAKKNFIDLDPRWINTYYALADSAMNANKIGLALNYFDCGIRVARELGQDRAECQLLNESNAICISEGDWDRGLAQSNRCLELLLAKAPCNPVEEASFRFQKSIFISRGFEGLSHLTSAEIKAAFSCIERTGPEDYEVMVEMLLEVGTLFQGADLPVETCIILDKAREFAELVPHLDSDIRRTVEYRMVKTLVEASQFGRALNEGEKLLDKWADTPEISPTERIALQQQISMAMLGLNQVEDAFAKLEVSRADFISKDIEQELDELNITLSLGSLYHLEGYFRRCSDIVTAVEERVFTLLAKFPTISDALTSDTDELATEVKVAYGNLSPDQKKLALQMLDTVASFYRLFSWIRLQQGSMDEYERFSKLCLEISSLGSVKGLKKFFWSIEAANQFLLADKKEEALELLEDIDLYDENRIQRISKSLRSRVHQLRAIVNLGQSNHEGAYREVEQALQLAQASHGPVKSHTLGGVLFVAGRIAQEMGDLSLAEGHFRNAEDVLIKAGREQHPHMLRILEGLSLCAEGNGDFAHSQEISERIKELRDTLIQRDGPEYHQG